MAVGLEAVYHGPGILLKQTRQSWAFLAVVMQIQYSGQERVQLLESLDIKAERFHRPSFSSGSGSRMRIPEMYYGQTELM